MKATHLLYRRMARAPQVDEAPVEGIQNTGSARRAAGGEHKTLADLQLNERGIVVLLSGGRAVIQRLAALGFTPGAGVEVTQNYGWGPLIVSTRGARVALGRGEARGVTVEREQP